RATTLSPCVSCSTSQATAAAWASVKTGGVNASSFLPLGGVRGWRSGRHRRWGRGCLWWWRRRPPCRLHFVPGRELTFQIRREQRLPIRPALQVFDGRVFTRLTCLVGPLDFEPARQRQQRVEVDVFAFGRPVPQQFAMPEIGGAGLIFAA